MSIKENAIKYILEGIAVAIVTSIISGGKVSLYGLLTLSLTVTLVLAVLDLYAPLTAMGARQGAGFGLGFKLVGGEVDEKHDMCGGNGLEGFEGMDGAMDGLEGFEGMDGGNNGLEGMDGGLLMALQDAGAPTNIIPYKLVQGDYGMSVVPGFNENAEGYNIDKMSTYAVL